MLPDLIPASLAAFLVGVAPGWFWTESLRAPLDLAERLALSVALSMALVPAAALVPTRLFGMGVTLPVALACALAVFLAGLGAYLRFGPAKGDEGPVVPDPAAPLPTPALVPLAAALCLALCLALGIALGVVPGDAVPPAVTGDVVPTRRTVLVIAALVLAAGVLHLFSLRRRKDGDSEVVGPFLPAISPWARRLLLPGVLLLVLARGYVGPVLHDWPVVRGVDHYSHAVMANRMMEVGRIEPYLIYPPASTR